MGFLDFAQAIVYYHLTFIYKGRFNKGRFKP